MRPRAVMPRKQKGPFPNEMAASNYFAYQRFAVTCEKQNISIHDSVLGMADDPFWDMFLAGIGPFHIQKHLCNSITFSLRTDDPGRPCMLI